MRYEYAAVSPWDGCLDNMTAEKMNTENMSLFLAQVSEAHRDEFIIMVLDGASSREYAYDRKSGLAKLDKGLDDADKYHWVIVDMKNDWKKVYPFDK